MTALDTHTNAPHSGVETLTCPAEWHPLGAIVLTPRWLNATSADGHGWPRSNRHVVNRWIVFGPTFSRQVARIEPTYGTRSSHQMANGRFVFAPSHGQPAQLRSSQHTAAKRPSNVTPIVGFLVIDTATCGLRPDACLALSKTLRKGGTTVGPFSGDRRHLSAQQDFAGNSLSDVDTSSR